MTRALSNVASANGETFHLGNDILLERSVQRNIWDDDNMKTCVEKIYMIIT